MTPYLSNFRSYRYMECAWICNWKAIGKLSWIQPHHTTPEFIPIFAWPLPEHTLASRTMLFFRGVSICSLELVMSFVLVFYVYHWKCDVIFNISFFIRTACVQMDLKIHVFFGLLRLSLWFVQGFGCAQLIFVKQWEWFDVKVEGLRIEQQKR